MARLEYDTAASNFFFLAVFLASLAAATFWWLPRALSVLGRPKPSFAAIDAGTPAFMREARESLETQEYNSLQTQSKKRLVVLALGWALAAVGLAFQNQGATVEIKHFDPFEILGITEKATEAEIKKAYRKLSLVYHPDRWSQADKAEKALAETRFVKVAKAYEALTDDVARDNFAKYGNPDGRQALEMSIGLPSFLLEKENQYYIIAMYLITIIAILPASVALFTAQAVPGSVRGHKAPKERAELGRTKVLPDTQEILRVVVRSGAPLPRLVEALALGAEFRILPFRDEAERSFVGGLKRQLVEEGVIPRRGGANNEPTLQAALSIPAFEGCEKAYVLLHVHFTRKYDALSAHPGLLEDLVTMLRVAPPIVKGIVAHARTTCSGALFFSAIRLSQCFHQALLPTDSALKQLLPAGATPQEREAQLATLKEFSKHYLGASGESLTYPANKSWSPALIQLTQKKGLSFTEEALLQLQARLKAYPARTTSVHVGTPSSVTYPGGKKDPKDAVYEWEPVNAQGDLLHIALEAQKIDESAATSGKAFVPALTPFLPMAVSEEWWCVALGGPAPTGMSNIPSGSDKIVATGTAIEDRSRATQRFQISFFTSNRPNDWLRSGDFPKGENAMTVYLVSSVYAGLDSEHVVKFTLVDPSEVQHAPMHELDEALGNEPPSLFAMLAQPTAGPPPVDSDFDDDDGRAPRAHESDSEEEDEDDNHSE